MHVKGPQRLHASNGGHPGPLRLVRAILFVLLVATLAVGGVRAADVATEYPQARTFFPDADRFGTLEARRARHRCIAANACSATSS